jgi:serine/threonine-protein kinase
MAPPALILENRYRLDDRIAAGGMGEVWRAADLLLGRAVAVKLLRPAYCQDESGLARFRAEAKYAGSLSHPNIAQVYDYWGGDPPGQPYLVMELVDGPSLAATLAAGPLAPGRALEIIGQAAAGLQAAHAAGLVHRDIKPGNLLLSQDGQVKIADFGIAHAVGSAPVTRTGELIGTPAYLSPEQVSGRQATPAADLYALGIVAYQCLTGEVPFTGEPLAVALAQQEASLPPLPPSVPPAVAALVTDLTAKDPRARPATAEDVAGRAEYLRAALAGEAGPGAEAVLAGSTALAGDAARAGDAATYPGFPAAVPATAVDMPAAGGPPAGGPGAGLGSPAGPPRRRFGSLPGRPALPAWLSPRAALALAGVAVLALTGWLVASLPGQAAHRHPAPPPAARPSGPATGSAAIPSSPAGPSTAATPAHGNRGHAASPSPAGSPSASTGPAPTPSAPPTPAPSPSGQPTPAPSGTPTATPTAPPAAT